MVPGKAFYPAQLFNGIGNGGIGIGIGICHGSGIFKSILLIDRFDNCLTLVFKQVYDHVVHIICLFINYMDLLLIYMVVTTIPGSKVCLIQKLKKKLLLL